VPPRKTLIGYCDPLSVRPGDTVAFKVSCYAPGPYRADIVRVICGDASSAGAGFQEREIATPVSGEHSGREQTTTPGSWALVPELPALDRLTLQALIWPTLPMKQGQVIAGTWDAATRSGFALVIEDGALAFVIGDGAGEPERCTTGAYLRERAWHRVSATYDGNSGEIRVQQHRLAVSSGLDTRTRSASASATVRPGLLAASPRAFRFAAAGTSEDGGVTGLYNGKIDSPRLSRAVLDDGEIERLFAARIADVEPGLRETIVGFWDLSADVSSERVRDLSGHGLDGETVNLPTRGVTGFRWDGSEQRYSHAPEQYGAIHFHDDDLYDAGWETDFELEVPADLPSGIYAARLRQGESDDYVPFFVRPARGKRTADVVFLASTATYLAYANTRLHLLVDFLGARDGPLHPNDQLLTEHPEWGASLYEHHSDNSGVHHSSRLRPISNMKPKTAMWSFNADTNITAWLEQTGTAYDVVTDEDLHCEGAAALDGYRVVVTGSHPEYWSTDMLDSLDGWLRNDGRLMYLGGNGFYWRIAHHPERRDVIEVRRAEDGTRAWIAEPGEYYHAWTGEYGGLWRRLGRPPNQIAGVGFAAQGFDRGSGYDRMPGSRDPRAAFVFEGTDEGEHFGDYGSIGGGAAGQEIDRFDTRLGSPPHALVLATSRDHSEQMLRTKEEFLMTTPQGPPDGLVHSDLTFFELAGGGAVFSTGSITWAGALAHDGYRNDVVRITTNVLLRFADPKPFEVPGASEVPGG